MADCKAIVMVDAGNIRAQANASSSIVGIARRNDSLPVSEVSAADSSGFRWFRVVLPANNARGWVREDLVQLQGDCAAFGAVTTSPAGTPISGTQPAPTPPPATPAPTISVLTGDCQGEVNVFLARVRSAPSTSGTSLGMLPRNTRFAIKTISPVDNDGFKWYSFDFEGQTGWTREDLVTITGDCLDPNTHDEPVTTPPVEAPINNQPPPAPSPPISQTCLAGVQLARINLRASPSASAALVGQGLAGQKFAVVDVTPVQADGFPWVKIDFNNSMAFVRFDLVALEGDCANFVHDDRLTAPVAANISQGFHSQHRAVDFPVPVGTPLINRLAGVVVRSMACPNCQGTPSHIFSNDPAVRDSIFNDPNWGFGFGEHLIIRHNFTDIPPSSQQQFFREGAKESDFIFVLYAHLSRRDVQLNQTLRSGDSLGLTGHTGYSTAPHLHMEVAYGQDWGRSQKVHPATLFNIQRA